jgi:hypothetical protein
MGDWNEWNDLQETNDIFDQSEIEIKPKAKNKELVTDLVNEPNKYVYKRKIEQVNNNTNTKKNITKKITMYSSGSYGSYIVNPLDNTQYNIKVGSKDEVKFFSVRFAAKSFQGQDEPITLYYDSPYTYERHHHVSLPRHILQNWENTRLMLNKRPNFNQLTQPIEPVVSIDNLTDSSPQPPHPQEQQPFIQVK